MLWQAVTAARDLGRLQHIAAILIRYGFGDMVRRLGLADALEKAMRKRYTPRAIIKRGWQSVSDTLALAAGLSQDISRLLRAARRGRLEIHIDVTHLKRVGNQLDRAISRLVVGIVVAALIVGSSIVMTVPGGPSLFGLPFFGLLGFVGAVVGGLWLLLSIRQSGRVDAE